MAGLDWPLVLLVVAVATVGGLVQSVVGIGLGLLLAPVVAILEPALVPVLPLWLAALTAGWMSVTERTHIDWGALWWTMPARVLGVAVGAWFVSSFSDAAIGLGIGVMVLAGVAATAGGLHIPYNRGTLWAGGFASGVTGTATSIGGPPIALVFAGRDPDVVRATLASFFFVGVALGLGGLAWQGEVGRGATMLALVSAPFVLAGIVLGARLRPRLPRERFRTAILVVCAVSAVVLLLRSVV